MLFFKELLKESFNSPYKWRWLDQSRTSWTAGFKDKDGDEFGVSFIFSSIYQWSVVFGPWDGEQLSFDNTKKFDSRSVVSTIIDIVKRFLEEKQPWELRFTGNIESGKGQLYKKLLHHYKTKLDKIGLGYTYSEENVGMHKAFKIKLKSGVFNV